MFAALLELLSAPLLGWAPLITLVFLLVWHPWSIYAPLGSVADIAGKAAVVLSAIGVLLPPTRATVWLWLAIATAHFIWIAVSYHTADNHQYLIGYWCLAIAVALGDRDSGETTLQRNAFLLIGLCFALAVLAKLVRRRYRDASMFTYLLLLDPRFLGVATFFGGLRAEERDRHYAAVYRLRTGECAETSIPVSRRLRRVAVFLAWWTIAIEVSVSILHLVRFDSWEPLRLTVMAVFVLSTYLLVSVPGFGQVLLIMMMVTVSDPVLRAVFLLAALLLTPVSFLPQWVMRIALAGHAMKVNEDGRQALLESGTSVHVRTT